MATVEEAFDLVTKAQRLIYTGQKKIHEGASLVEDGKK